MRKFLFVLAAIAGLAQTEGARAQGQPPGAVPAAVLPAGPMKVAYINSEKLVQQAPGALEARTTFEREMNKYKAELALLDDSIKNMIADYTQKQITLSPDAKKKQEDAIRVRSSSFETRSQQAEQTLAKRQQELMEPIMDRINKAMNDYRKENGISIIFDAAARGIISADSALDVTDAVLAKLKGPAAAGAPKKPGN
ncbi:MAG: OmpH family outer membrane protein [Gemmatimonadota bacterium]